MDPKTSMYADFLGRGWGFPVAPDQNFAIQLTEGDRNVEDSIWMILATAHGERVMRPDFGCGIHELVFDTVTAATGGRVAAAVREALLRFEPRIDVRDVAVSSGG